MSNSIFGSLKLAGEAEELYSIVRRDSYRGKYLNVYKVHEKNNPENHYVIKSYKTKEAIEDETFEKESFERESQMLSELRGAKNVIQMIHSYESQLVIVCEFALYDLKKFLSHQDYIRRHKEKGSIIKDVVSGLSELKNHNIVHTELLPKNVMYFRDGNWKLIDFDKACFNNLDYVCIMTNYSAPEVIRAYEEDVKIKANFAMDMFSFGLILYFLETGHYYLNEMNEGINSETYLSLDDIYNPVAHHVIKKLLDKDISNRMTLEEFKQTPHYTGESELNIAEYNQTYYKDRCGMSESEFQFYCAKIAQEAFQTFLVQFHNETKESLKEMSNKIDKMGDKVDIVRDEFPQWLIKLKNEKVPRVFIIIPDQKDWKKPTMWFSKPFRLLFVCEHKNWHIPEQEGYKILKVHQFIRKYGPWINLCLQAICSILHIVTSNVFFSRSVSELLSSVFDVVDNTDILQCFQEIMDTVCAGAKAIIDNDDDDYDDDDDHNFNPNASHKIVNVKELRELKKFLDTQENADHFGGLVQCIVGEEVLWLCKEHSDEYSRPISPPSDLSRTPPSKNISPSPSPKNVSPSPPPKNVSPSPPPKNVSPSPPPKNVSPSPPQNISSSPPQSISPPESNSSTLTLNTTLYTSSPPSSPSLTAKESFIKPSPTWDYSKFDKKNLTESLDPSDPYFALDYIYKILGEIVENATLSEKNFRNDDIKKIAHGFNENMKHFKPLCSHWNYNEQKIQFIGILKNQAHLYVHFLMLIVRYYARKIVFDSKIDSITRAGKSFNSHLRKLISVLKESQRDNQKGGDTIQNELNNFVNDPDFNVNIDDDSVIASYKTLSKWYYTVSRTHIESPAPEIQKIGGGLYFESSKRRLDKFTTVLGKSLKYLDNDDNFLCVMKEIHFYNEYQLNDNDYIIKFCGYSIHNCKLMLFYDHANYGDLFEYFQKSLINNDDLLKDWKERTKLAWEISQGVRYLHKNKIIHLDLRSANILLKYDEEEKTLTPRISNFLWSRYIHDKTSVHPKLIIQEEEMWKRWYDPDRLSHTKHFKSLLQSSDIYSLGLLFWEIAWFKPNNLPFKNISIKKLYNHLKNNNYEELPNDISPNWKNLINNMWKFKSDDRCNIFDVESTMKRFYNIYNKNDKNVD